MLAGPRGAGDLDLAIRNGCIGVDAGDAVFHPIPQIESYQGAIGHGDAIDRERIAVTLAGGCRRPGGWVGHACSFAQQRMVQNRAGDHEFGDLRVARPYARQCHIGLNAADGQAIGSLGVFRVLQRDVGQRHVELWPQADFGRARYRQPISGFALDPGLDLRAQEAGGDPDDQQQGQDNDDGRGCGAGDFQCSHDDIPNRPQISARPYRGARPFPQAYPGKGRLLKAAKNIPGVLQSYVTYDTLRQHMNLRSALF